MRSVKITSDTWNPLTLQYVNDDSIDLNNTLVNTKDGVNFYMAPALSGCNDTKINNYSELMLTDPMQSESLYDFRLERNVYPKQYTTYILLNSYPNIQPESSYLMITPKDVDHPIREYIVREGTVTDPDTGEGRPVTSEYFKNETDNNNIYFSVTMHNEQELSIAHDDNFTTVYLTTVGTPENGTLNFIFSAAPLDIPREDQKFNYITQNEDGYILLYRYYNNTPYYITVSMQGDGELTTVRASDVDQVYPMKGVIRTVPQEKTSVRLSMDNNWVSYKTAGNQNNLNINESKSVDKINNNYLLSTQYSTVTGDTMLVDIMPLKNQLTPGNKVMRGNPFPNFKQSDHRQYSKIFSGTNQKTGNENMYIGYESYQTEISLEPDTITYFNTPQDMYPYDKLNINDSGLIEAGAIGGDTPIVSDKIFKKAADYRFNTPYGAPSDEETGVWLCSWLKSNIGVSWDKDTEYNSDVVVNYKGKVYSAIERNTGVVPSRDARIWFESKESKPVWVDRYYNPAAFSATEALRIENQYSEYVSKYNYIINTLSAEDIYVFDKISDLTFEPGCAYAYYRVGPQENDVTINSIPNLVHSGQQPTYNFNRAQQVRPEEELLFDGTKYVETNTLAKTKDSSYTIAFDLHSLDWTKPFASQVVGNYVNEGVTFYNKINTTPYVIISNDNTTDVYNSDMVLKLSIPRGSVQAVHGNGSENIIMLCIESGEKVIHQYDMKGMLVETTTLTELSQHNIVCMDSDDRYLYFLTDSSDNNRIYKYSIDNEFRDYLNTVSPGHIIGTAGHELRGATDPVNPFEDSAKTFLHVHNENQYRINCDYYNIDMDDNIWFTKGQKVFKYIVSERRGANATFSEVINGGSVSLVAEEYVTGTLGNLIKLVGDGISTVANLVGDWNRTNPDNQLQIVDALGSSIVIPLGKEIQLTGGVDLGSPVSYTAFETGDYEIKGLNCCYHNHVWVLGVNDTSVKIWKYDTKRNKLLDILVNNLDTTLIDINNVNEYRMDFICEINNDAGYTHYISLLHTTTDNQIAQTKITTGGELISTSTKNIQIDSLNRSHDITNFDTSKSINRGLINTNHIIFKMRYQSYFDTDKTYTVQMNYNLEELTPGSHHFAVGFNSNNANISLFIDGNLHETVKSDDIFTGAAYKFTKTIHAPLHAGCDTFFNNVTLGEHIGKDNYSYATGNTISDIRVYNEYLNFYKIKSLTRKSRNIQPLTLTLPTGRRSYLDKVHKFYRHRTPGRRSDSIDVDIIPESVVQQEFKDKLKIELKDMLEGSMPVNKKIREVNWIDE